MPAAGRAAGVHHHLQMLCSCPRKNSSWRTRVQKQKLRFRILRGTHARREQRPQTPSLLYHVAAAEASSLSLCPSTGLLRVLPPLPFEQKDLSSRPLRSSVPLDSIGPQIRAPSCSDTTKPSRCVTHLRSDRSRGALMCQAHCPLSRLLLQG